MHSFVEHAQRRMTSHHRSLDCASSLQYVPSRTYHVLRRYYCTGSTGNLLHNTCKIRVYVLRQQTALSRHSFQHHSLNSHTSLITISLSIPCIAIVIDEEISASCILRTGSDVKRDSGLTWFIVSSYTSFSFACL
jgi:hypothetical protein